MQQAVVNGMAMQYEVAGSGEPVLLIGTGPIADSFLPLLSDEALVEDYRLITYRQRRLADSIGGPGPVSFVQHAADAFELLVHLKVGRAHVAGHSTGAAIALQLTVDHPETVHTLTLLEPPLVGAPSAGAFFEKAGPALDAYAAGDRPAAMASFLSLVCGLEWPTCERVIEKRIPDGVAQAMNNADSFFESYLPALNAWQFGTEQAAAISQPVLSVVGANSDQWFQDSHELLHSWFPQVEDCKVGGVAHLLHLQEAEPVARGIRQFLARNPIGPV